MIISFFDDDSPFTLPKTCIELREFFGIGFNEKSIKALINMNGELTKDVKSDLYEACTQVLLHFSHRLFNLFKLFLEIVYQ